MRGSNIETYNAPDRTIRPASEGFAAFENAARRIPTAYREAATAYEEVGRLQAQSIEARKWPFDILALENANRTSIRFGSDRSPRGGGGGGDHQAFNRIAMGAGALGSYLGSGVSPGGEVVDVANGTTSIGRQNYAGTSGNLLSPPDWSQDNTPPMQQTDTQRNVNSIDQTQIGVPPAWGIDQSPAGTPAPYLPGDENLPGAQNYQGGGGWFSGLGNALSGGDTGSADMSDYTPPAGF